MSDLNDLVGKPYVLGARGPDAYDCWGLCVEVAARRGIVLPAYGDVEPSRTTLVRTLRHGPEAHGAIAASGPEEGAFALDPRRGHIGIMVSGGVLHAVAGLGVVWHRVQEFVMLYPDTEWWAWRT